MINLIKFVHDEEQELITGSVNEVIGSTPLIEIKSLSRATGCQIFGKAEFLNPGGSVKDRAALGIIEDAEAQNILKPGMRVYEGTAGNTGIGLAIVAAQKGYACTIVMPDNQSREKYAALEAHGVDLICVPAVPFKDENHFYHTAKRLAENDEKGFWANQFENTSNGNFHFRTTGPEIWEQTEGEIFSFSCAAGSGGTIGGVSKFLKTKNSSIQCSIIDPLGSGLYHWFHSGEIRSEGGSVTEGIGIMRITENIKMAQIDDVIQIDDSAMIDMLYYLARFEGLLVGPSAALNVMGTFRLALKEKGSGKKFVTILCDSGMRYQNRVFNKEWLKEKGFEPDLKFLMTI